MTVTNTDEKPVVDDDKTVTEEDIRDLKYPKDGVETSSEADEPTAGADDTEDTEEASDDDETADTTEDEDSEDDSKDDSTEETSEFVKEFTNIKGETLEDYARGLEEAYKQSTAEALRLKGIVDTKPKDPEIGETTDAEVDLSDPVSLFMKQKMDEEITAAYGEFSKHFPQVADPSEYAKFTQEVATLSQTILNSQKRLAPPKELYSKAAVILGWEPDNKVDSKDKLNMALKNTAAVSKTTSSGSKKSSKSKVTDQMVAANRLMYPNKTDAQIREELEPYVT